MGLYLNQLPQTEVARLKAELAETLIANFCYPRFYDYRIGALRTRPVDRVKRQEVWQYLNAVDFNVWGRVDVDSPEFQRQVERLFIHFVQRNRSFFGEQGRRRMTDVRTLISSCSLALADGLRGHLRGQHGNASFGNPRPVTSWATSNITGRTEAPWEQILSGTMLLQQQLQEARGEVRPASPPTQEARSEMRATSNSGPEMRSEIRAASNSGQEMRPAPAAMQEVRGEMRPAPTPVQTPAGRQSSGPTRRTRNSRALSLGNGNGNPAHEEDISTWPTANNRSGRLTDASASPAFSAASREHGLAQSDVSSHSPVADPAPTLPLGRVENIAVTFQPTPTEVSPALSTRSRRSKSAEASPVSSLVAPSSPGSSPRSASQPAPSSSAISPVPVARQQVSSPLPADGTSQQRENSAAASEEDVVIFEQMRHQLGIWLRVEAVRAGIELGGQNSFQLVEVLRHQEDADTSRLQVVSTLLGMCDQIIAGGRATLFDYKQAMMFYLMHTRRG